MKLWRKFCTLFTRNRLEREMAEEMEAHLDELTERNIASGMSAKEARYAAQRTFGGVEQIKELARDERSWVWIEQVWQDLRYAVRMMGRKPGVTCTIVMTLALGIGVNAALFGVYNFVVLQPLPSHQPEELFDIQGMNETLPGRLDSRFSYPDFLDYSEGTQTFSDIVAVSGKKVFLQKEAALAIGSEQESQAAIASIQMVSGNYFPALGGKINLGRNFLPEEAGLRAGRPVIVLSHLFWQTHLHGDAGILGTTLTTQELSGMKEQTDYTIIGVTAPDFLGQSAITPAGWIPLTAQPGALTDRSRRLVKLTGRVNAGISPPQAKADLDAIARRLSQLYPEERRAISVRLTPGMKLVSVDALAQIALPMSPVLLGFGLTLLVACLNVTNLLLARGVTRQHEIGVRLALGATRSRIVRQLFAENFLLCVLGAVVAMLMALWSLQVLRPFLLSAFGEMSETRNFLSRIEIGLDRRIIGFGALMAVVTGLTAGLAPALHSVKRNVVFALKGEGSAFGKKVTPSRLRAFLLVAQIAVCLTLLSVSGLITGKLLSMDISDSGLSFDGVYRMRPSSESVDGNALSRDPLGAVETLRTLPEVASACLVSETPMRKPGDNFRGIRVDTGDGKLMGFPYSRISAGFFETCGVPVLRGRTFSPREVAIGAPFVIVSESVAKRLWPEQEAVGKFLSVDASGLDRRIVKSGDSEYQNMRDYEIIGVASGIRNNWSRNDRKELLWFPLMAKGVSGSILLRLQTDSLGVMRGVERMAEAADVPVEFREKLSTIVDGSLWPYRAFASFSLALSCLALVMATIGLYGVVSFGVNQRTKEIGVRMALGATTQRVVGLFVRQNMRLVAWGVAWGLVGGAAFAVLIGRVVPGAGFSGGWFFRFIVFAVVTLFLVSVSLIASWLPARRAAKVDPMVALRSE